MKPGEAAGETFRGKSLETEAQIQFQCSDNQPATTDDLLRCVCGALLARWVAAGLELKCRRCKRVTLIPYPKRSAVTRRHPA